MESAWGITAANDGRIMVADSNSRVHVFSEHGDHLDQFEFQGYDYFSRFAFHRASEQVIVVRMEEQDHLLVEIFTKDGELVRRTQIQEGKTDFLQGMTVSTHGRIAMTLCQWGFEQCKVLVL